MGSVAVAVPVWFREQMTRLMGLKFAPADLTTHWEALSDVPEPVLAAAVSRAQRSRVDFPTPIELRQDADAVRMDMPRHERNRLLIDPLSQLGMARRAIDAVLVKWERGEV